MRAFREAQTPKQSRRSLAEDLGVHQTQIVRWEQGGQAPRTPEMLLRIEQMGIAKLADWMEPAEDAAHVG